LIITLIIINLGSMTSTTVQTWIDETEARAAAARLREEGVEARTRSRGEVWSVEVSEPDLALAVALLELRALRARPAAPPRRPRLSSWLAPAMACLSGGVIVTLLLVGHGPGARALPGERRLDVDGDGRVDAVQHEDGRGALRVAYSDDDRDGRLERAVIVGRDGRVSTTWHDDDEDGLFERFRRVDPRTGRTLTLADEDGDGFPERVHADDFAPRSITGSRP
jgi:hypothetical protein